jgi:hypothetical protein
MEWLWLIPMVVIAGMIVRRKNREAEVGLLDRTANWRRVRSTLGGKRIAH